MVLPVSLDVELLLDAVGDDRETATDLVRLYFELTGQEMIRLETAVETGDFSTISSVAHKCAGSSVACGMMVLSKMLRELEVESADSMPTDMPERLEKIKQEMAAVKTTAEEYFKCTFTP